MRLEELIGKKVCRRKSVLLEAAGCITGEMGEIRRYMKPDDAILVIGEYEDSFVVISDKEPTEPYFLIPYFYDDEWYDIEKPDDSESDISDIESETLASILIASTILDYVNDKLK